MAIHVICSIPECDKYSQRRGMCYMHYRRLMRHGSPNATKSTPKGDPKRFYQEVVETHDGKDCLIWPYTTNGFGYGQISRDGRMVLVSRLVCEKENGPPPTPEHEAAHSCGKGHFGCVAKSHLSWKTPAENTEDKARHGTIVRGEVHYRAKLSEDDVLAIFSLAGKETQLSLGDRYGVSVTTVCQIQTGKRWAWLTK